MKTDSFGIRVPVRDVGTILYYYYTEIGSHGLTVGSCLRDVISQTAAQIRSERPEMALNEEQATQFLTQLKSGNPSGRDFGFSAPKPTNIIPASNIDPEELVKAAREISEKEKPRPVTQFEADIIDD